jgi:alpha-tubulin suppressor-like RCC1 family protein
MSPSTRLTLGIILALIAGTSCRDDTTIPTAPGSNVESALTTTTIPLAFFQLDVGLVHTCGITTENKAYCWGWNHTTNGALKYGAGQLGDGTETDRYRPVAVVGGLLFRQISPGAYFTCGVTTVNRAYCWGWNEAGQLGDGTTTRRLRPVPVAGGLRFRQVSAGYTSACGVSYPDNRVFCWGHNGALGDGTTMRRLTPVPVGGSLRFRQVSSGWVHTCAVATDNLAYCWGGNRYGQRGDGSTLTALTPTRVAGTLQFRAVDAGGNGTCGVTTSDRAYCWGDNLFGQIGDGQTASKRLYPRAVTGGHLFREVTTDAYSVCGVTTTDGGYCWGDNGAGQLGDGTMTHRRQPTLVAGGQQFRQVSAGLHSCGRNLSRKGYCWGDNGGGAIGDGTTISRTMPRAVVGPM